MRIALVLAVCVAGAYAALPLNEYLPPLEDASPVINQDLQSLSEQSSPLGDDGYRYKTIRRYRLRHRRDVNELPSNDYLPPVVGAASSNNFVADVPVAVEAAESQDSAVLADDGYRYKTVKRYRYRHRRDVNELPANDYLPPVAESAPVAYEAPAQYEAPVAVAHESAPLADDGYRYKTVRRVVYRRRF